MNYLYNRMEGRTIEYIFSLIALIIVAVILLLSPVGIHIKGKLLIIFLIMFISVLGYMANLILQFWQTVGLILLLVVLFTYLLYKRESSLFIDLKIEAVEDSNYLPRRKNLSVRMKESDEYKSSILIKQEIVSSTDVNIEEIEVTEDEVHKDSLVIDFVDSSYNSMNVEGENEWSEATNIQETNVMPINSNMKTENHLHNIDSDLDTLVNRKLEENSELEDNQSSLFFQHEKEEDIISSRDLEKLVEDKTDLSKRVESEPEYVIEEKIVSFDENEHFIEEIQLSPIKVTEKIEKEKYYDRFDLIEEIKDFKKRNESD